MPRILPRITTRYSSTSRPARFEEAAIALSLDLESFSRAESAVVVNAVNALYHRTKSVDDISEPLARSLGVAFGIPIPPDAGLEATRTAIASRFLDSAAIAALTNEALTSADRATLLDWADTLNVGYEANVTEAELIEIVNQARGAHDNRDNLGIRQPHSPGFDPTEECTLEVLARMSTPSVKIRYAYWCEQHNEQPVSRTHMVEELLRKRTRSVDASEVGNLAPSAPLVAQVAPVASNVASSSYPSFNAMFSSARLLCPTWSDCFVQTPLPFVEKGNLAILQEEEPTLFHVTDVNPVVLQSLKSPQVVGSLTAIPFLWIANAAGLSRLAPLLPAPIASYLAGEKKVIPLSPAVPSIKQLLAPSIRTQLPSIESILGVPSDRQPSMFPSTGSHAVLEPGSGTLAQQDRLHELRGVHACLFNKDRVFTATNGTGKFHTDSAFNHFIMCIAECDRDLPAAQQKFLKHLVSLHFALSFDADKPSGIHLQAFSPKGKPLMAIWQIRDAVVRMTRMLDDLRSPGSRPTMSSQPRFFESLFSNIVHLLDTGDHVGLKDLPPDLVLSLISNKLLALGCLANSPSSDSWDTEDSQRSALRQCLNIDVAQQLTIAAARAWRPMPKTTPSKPGKGDSRDRGKPAGRLNYTAGGRGSGRGGRGLPRSTTLPSGDSSGTPAEHTSNPAGRALCISALMKKYNQGTGCPRQATCRFEHDMAKNTKAEEIRAANNMIQAAAKQALLTAIDSHNLVRSYPPSHDNISVDNDVTTCLTSRFEVQSDLDIPLSDHIWLSAIHADWSMDISAPIRIAEDFIRLLSPADRFGDTTLFNNLLLTDKIRELCEKYSIGKTELLAERDASNFRFPAEVFSRDLCALQQCSSLKKFVVQKQSAISGSRFNVRRCHECFLGDPEFETLLSIASEGARIDTSPDFQPQSIPDPHRNIVQRIPHTIAKHAYKLWLEGSVLIVPQAALQSFRPHYNNIHWCPKPGVPAGRFLGDCSNRVSGDVLNSLSAKERIVQRYGDLRHPTIEDLVTLIFRVANKAGGLHRIALWKEDVAGAFGQYNHHADDVHYLSFPLQDELALIYLVGMFGWTGSPFVFGVFSRALGRQANSRISGELAVYVDDFMAVSPLPDASSDQKRTQQLVLAAFGPSAINLSKSVPPSRQADFIGWFIDLDTETLRPNTKGIEKIVVAFFSIDMSIPHALRTFQVLASLACRYSRGLMGMRPFVQPLYAMTRKFLHPNAKRSVSSQSKLAITMWRAIGLVLLTSPSSLATPLASLIRDPSSWELYIISDAGPYAIGLAVFRRNCDTCMAHISYRLPFNASDSKYQNVREFQGLLLGHLVLYALGVRHRHIQWRGDNTSALTWARKEACKSSAAQASFIAYSWLSTLSGNGLVSANHQAGTSMGDIDSLSRFRDTSFSEETNIGGTLLGLDSLFVLCDPTCDDSNLTQHVSVVCRIMTIFQRMFPRA